MKVKITKIKTGKKSFDGTVLMRIKGGKVKEKRFFVSETPDLKG